MHTQATYELFRIHKIGTHEAERINSAPNDPHVHDFEELIIVNTGELIHFIDFETRQTEAPMVSFITKGKVHKVKPQPADGVFDAWLIRFNSDFIPELLFQLYAFYHNRSDIRFNRDTSFERLLILSKMMFEEMRRTPPDLAIVQHLLSAVLTMVESQRRFEVPESPAFSSTQNLTFRNFLSLLEANYWRPVGVDFYASKLFMSSRNLNLICQQILQQSVSSIIETRKLTEAKNLLVSTDKTIAEIGYELGYNEKAYFTNVFKKKSGLPPGEFRREMRRKINNPGS